MTTILIVRHGYSVSNFNKTFTGHINAPLADKGLMQGELVSDYIFNHYKVDSIYSSDLSRAVSTIMPLAKKLNLTINSDKNLREIYGGKWEGEKVAELAEKYPVDYQKWHDYARDMRPTGGESMLEVQERAKIIFNKIAQENLDKTVVVATHGGLIKAFQASIMGIEIEELKNISYIPNAGIMELKFENGKFSIEKQCIDSYLGDLRTEMPKGV